MSAASIPQLAKWTFKDGASPYTYNSNRAWDFTGDSVGESQALIFGQGFTGGRALISSRTRQDVKVIGGRLTMNPSPAFLAEWLPRMMGSAGPGTFTLANTLPTFGMMASRVAGVVEYKDCQVAGWTLTGSAGLLTLSLDILGLTSATGGTFPVGAVLGTTAGFYPYTFTDCVLSLGGTEIEIDDFSITCSQGSRPKFRNALTARLLAPGQRQIGFGINSPFVSGQGADWWRAFTNAPVALSLAITNGTVSDTITTSGALAENTDPVVDNDDEIMYPINGAIASVAGASEITWTNDATP